MYYSYKSDYPNQVHQLNFSISKNYYLLKNGEIKYQQKKFDINWKNFEQTGKRHLVNFLIRDHYSNCFYAEIHPIDNLPNIKDFLFNAWRRKTNYEFCGIPKNLIVGRHVTERFPDILNLTKNIGLNIELAKNGFATGIRSMRDWESNIKFISYFEQYRKITDFQLNIEKICRKLNIADSGKTEPNLQKWANNKPQGKLINDKTEFEKIFE
ncbi:hypothetical protein SAMN05444274_12013 [Mariniphaga anaerophila]|uniref:Uncharacterized protein n=1 Tax=Mariniphaga anaerophila TaxID=1484053 RepID=A0A1M5GES9_9BACT|nr:hypothetical protein [Mariniphaga anaerophila]SHG02233.1 hypothetical protein SAMN05444274_12013 [Mariniphaga anaerophila]